MTWQCAIFTKRWGDLVPGLHSTRSSASQNSCFCRTDAENYMTARVLSLRHGWPRSSPLCLYTGLTPAPSYFFFFILIFSFSIQKPLVFRNVFTKKDDIHGGHVRPTVEEDLLLVRVDVLRSGAIRSHSPPTSVLPTQPFPQAELGKAAPHPWRSPWGRARWSRWWSRQLSAVRAANEH